MEKTMLRDKLMAVLSDMDKAAELFETVDFEIYFMGGAACILGGYTDRATRDFDFIDLEYDAKMGKIWRNIMYRIFRESYKNFIEDFDAPNARNDLACCFALLAEPSLFKRARETGDAKYREAEMLLSFLRANEDKYPQTKVLLWEMADAGVSSECCEYPAEAIPRMESQAKLITSFMQLAYWN